MRERKNKRQRLTHTRCTQMGRKLLDIQINHRIKKTGLYRTVGQNLNGTGDMRSLNQDITRQLNKNNTIQKLIAKIIQFDARLSKLIGSFQTMYTNRHMYQALNILRIYPSQPLS